MVHIWTTGGRDDNMEIRGSFKNIFFYRYVMYVQNNENSVHVPRKLLENILYFVFEKLTSVIFIYILRSVEKYCISVYV